MGYISEFLSSLVMLRFYSLNCFLIYFADVFWRDYIDFSVLIYDPNFDFGLMLDPKVCGVTFVKRKS